MPKDFRASQIETSKLILSGGIAGTSAGALIYSGSVASNREGGVSDSAMLSNVGSDVFLFVSGTRSNTNFSRTDVTLFGGDIVVSGTLYAERQVIEVDGVVDGDMIVTGSLFVEPDTDSTKSVAFRKANGADIVVVDSTNSRVGVGVSDPDQKLEVSGRIHISGETASPSAPSNGDGGILYVKSDGKPYWISNEVSETDLTAAGGSSEWTRAAGDLHSTTNPTTTDVLVGNTAEATANTILKAGGGAVFNEQGAAVDFRVESDLKENALLVKGASNQVLILSGGAVASPHEAGGTDVAFYVSGTQGSQGTPTRGASLFGGDTIVSGALHARGAKKLLPTTNTTASLFIDNIADNAITSPGVVGNIVWGSKGGTAQAQARIGVGNASLYVSSSVGVGIGVNGSGGFIQNDNWHLYATTGDFFRNKLLEKDTSSSPNEGRNILNDSKAKLDFIVKGYNRDNVFRVSTPNNQVLILSGGAASSVDEGDGNDLAFYVSGSKISQGTSTRGTALFGGDLVVSGGIHIKEYNSIASGEGPLRITSNNADSDIQINHANDATSPFVRMKRSRGTISNPTQVSSGDSLALFGFQQYIGSSFHRSANVNIKSYGTISNSSKPALIEIKTVADGETVERTAAIIGGSGASPHGTISGSIHHTVGGISYLRAGAGVTVASASNGQITISSTGGGSEWTDASGVLHPADSSGAQTVIIGNTSVSNADIVLKPEGGADFNKQRGDAPNNDFVVFGRTGKVMIEADMVGANNHEQVLILSGGGGTSPDPRGLMGVTFFVSGTCGARVKPGITGEAVFGGDTLVSGSLTVHNMGHAGGTISGSIHHTDSGLSYLVAGSGVTVASASNGQVVISSTATSAEWTDEGDILRPADGVAEDVGIGGTGNTATGYDIFLKSDGNAVFNEQNNNSDFRIEGGGASYDHMFFVDGGTNRISIGTQGASPSSVVHIKDTSPEVRIQRALNGQDSVISFAGSGGVRGSMTGLAANTNDIVFKTFNGSSLEETARFGGDYSGEVRRVIFLSGSTMHAGAMQPTETTDINFFVSGAIGSKGGGARGTAVFGGDLLTSGALFIEGGRTYQSGEQAAIILDSNTQSRIVWDSAVDGAFAPDAQIYEAGGDLYLSASDDVNIRAEFGSVFITANGDTGNEDVDIISEQDDIKLRPGDLLQILEHSSNSGNFASFFAQPSAGVYQNVLDVADTGVVINEMSQAAYDFRVESDNNAGMFVVDAEEDVAMLNSVATSFAGESPGLGTDVAVFMSGTRDGINAPAPSGGGVVLASGDMFVSGAIYEQDQVLLSMRTVDDADQSTAAGAGNEYAVFIQSLYSAANPFNDVISAQNCAVNTTTGVISVTSLNHNKRYGQFSFMVRLVAPASTGDAFVTIRDNGAAGSILWQTQIKLIGGGNDEKCVAATVILPPNSKPTLTVKGAGGQVVTTKAGSTMTFKNA